MGLPFEPQPIEKLRDRYPDALLQICDVRRTVEGLDEPPSGNRRHVFDFEDGLRLIVSMDQLGPFVKLHVSASADGKLRGEHLLARARRAILSLDPAAFGHWEIEFHCEGAIAHLVLWERMAVHGDERPAEHELPMGGLG